MSKRQAIPALPPTSAIGDPHVRAFCEALSSAWSVRNGDGRDGERFVRASEIDSIASKAVSRALSGGSSMDVASMTDGGVADPTDVYNSVVKQVTEEVTGSPVYEYLNTPITLIEPPTDRLNEVLDGVNTQIQDILAAIEEEAELRGSGISELQISVVSELENLQSQVNTIVAVGSSDTATILAAIQAEQTARTTAISAEATSRNTLAAQMRGSYNGTDPALLTQGILFNERKARVTAHNAVVSQVNTLTARVGAAESSIVSEQTARTTADTTMASNINALTSRMNGAEASILSEQTTRINKDNAIAKAVNTIWSSIGGSAALIQDGQLASVTPSAVAATKWSQVQAAVTDPATGQVNSASIKGELSSYASKVDGTLKTTWGIRSNVSGVISGVSLMTTTGAGSSPGPATSHFMVQADRFSLVHPSNAALKPVPFTVDSSGNAVFTGTVYAAAGTFGGALSAATGTFYGSLIVGSTPALSGSSMSGSGARFYGTSANGSFVLGNASTNLSFNGTTLTLNGNIVSTPNINLGSVSQVLSAEFAGQTSGGTLMSLAISAIAGGRIQVMTGFVVIDSPSPSDMILRVYRNAGNTSVISGSSTLLREVNVGPNFGYSAFPPFFDAPGAGTWTYVVSRLGSTAAVRARSIVLTEMKR